MTIPMWLFYVGCFCFGWTIGSVIGHLLVWLMGS